MTAVLSFTRAVLDDTCTWGDRAACIGQANILEGDDVTAAKALCLGDPATGRPRCPVIDACHTWVIPIKPKNDPGGVRAGRTEEERNDFRKGRTTRHVTTGDKRCPRCEQIRPTSEFHRHRHHKDGLSAHCKTCEATRKATRKTAA